MEVKVKSRFGIIIFCLLLSFAALAGEDVIHREMATNLQSNGWHLAKSTEGGYSVEVPWPFFDSTINGSSPMYTIISASKNATTYTALFIPKGTQPGVFDTFKNDLINPAFEVGFHQDNSFIYDVETIEEQGFKFKLHTKKIKTESGIYILMVMAQPQNERPLNIETFYNSLVFADH